MSNDIRYINIGSLPNGALAPLATHPTATNLNPNRPAIASVNVQCNVRGEVTGLLSFAGNIQASLLLSKDTTRVIAYTLFNPNPPAYLQESVENICKAIHLFVRVVNNE